MPNFRLAILTAGFTLAAVCAFARTGPSAPIVVAYVFPRNGVLQPGQIDAAKLNRINNAFAKELGYDAGFGLRTTPVEVASFLAQEVARRAKSPSAQA